MDLINERFRDLRKACNKTQEEWGKILGITKSGVSEVESGRRKVTEQHLVMLSNWRERKININYLKTGNGQMFLELPLEDEVAAAVSEVLEDVHCENPFYTMIKEFLVQHERLDEDAKKHVDKYFDDVFKGLIEKKEGN